MLTQGILQNLEEYFSDLDARTGKAVFFYRINGWNEEIGVFLKKYYEAARQTGVVLDGKIPNPDRQNLAYFESILGTDFELSMGFLENRLKKWLPRLDEKRRRILAAVLYDTLDGIRREGKTENILRNAYVKFMCWLYYKFERVVNRPEGKSPSKILYAGNVSYYEWKLLCALSGAGSDVVLLQTEGDTAYLKLDPRSEASRAYQTPNMTAFPEGFSLKRLQEDAERERRTKQITGARPEIQRCTNAWLEGFGLEDILKEPQERGSDARFFYNCFCRINGAEDASSYQGELHRFYLEMKRKKRLVVIVENAIPKPTVEEIQAVSRQNYRDCEQAVLDLRKNISFPSDLELQKLMQAAFVEILLDGTEKEPVNRVVNRGVTLLCWLKRYQPQLFSGGKKRLFPCFIYLGGCGNTAEAAFMRLLSCLPTDVLILRPDLARECCLADQWLFDKNYPETLRLEKFPGEDAAVRLDTDAYRAERELDTSLYGDSGLYRIQQYAKADSVTLRTMYEEIAILWDEELKYRPNFDTTGNTAMLPVLFAKISGVKDGNIQQYWADVKKLVTADTFVIRKAPFIEPTDENPIKPYAVTFLKNGKLQREKIKAHSAYQYGFLREEMQEHILDKLQLLLTQKTIRGTFQNGTEYTIVSTALNLDRQILRMIQGFDFTKKNPKLLYILTEEAMPSLEDCILTAFLNLIGFDVVFFVPTGYRNIENYFNKQLAEEYRIGDYLYDLRAPEFAGVPHGTRPSWRDRIFKRGK